MLERIKKLCEQEHITLTYLEKQLGLSNSSIRKWDSYNPSIDKVQNIAEYFHVSVDYLLGKDPSQGYSDIDPIVLIKEKVRSGELSKEDLLKIIQVVTEELGK